MLDIGEVFLLFPKNFCYQFLCRKVKKNTQTGGFFRANIDGRVWKDRRLSNYTTHVPEKRSGIDRLGGIGGRKLSAYLKEGEMAIPFERRGSKRVKCQKDILHNTDPGDFFYRGKVCNYSKRGLYFESNVDLLPGNEVSILVKKVSNDVTYLLDVKIIWSKELKGPSFDLAYGASLKQRRKIGVR